MLCKGRIISKEAMSTATKLITLLLYKITVLQSVNGDEFHPELMFFNRDGEKM
jgi:hypothetical protein